MDEIRKLLSKNQNAFRLKSSRALNPNLQLNVQWKNNFRKQKDFRQSEKRESQNYAGHQS